MITIAEVIEQCALAAERNDGGRYGTDDMERIRHNKKAGERVRALAAQYEGCIVAEGSPQHGRSVGTPLDRAREAK